MKMATGVLVCCLLCGYCAAQDQPKPQTAALTVGKDGVIVRDGKPYRGIGINYFSAFTRTVANPEDTSYREGFEELAKRGIPFVRFSGCGFWPTNWKLYREDKEKYFRLFDGVVKCAEEKGVGLIPSLFWHLPCVPDLVDESCGQWGNPNSKTIAFMRTYTAEVVQRYKDSPAIWVWELGNEFSLAADLPNAADHRPPVYPNLGTRAARSAADDMTHDMIVTACRLFAEEVRKYDKQRPITTGHSLPRASAHHQRAEKSWTADSKDELQANLIDVTPDSMDLISIHVYPMDGKGRFNQEKTSYEELLTLCMQAAAKTGKALFVGEFGASDTEKDGGPETARKANMEMIAAIEKTRVPLAALWVFDLSDQDSFINVSPTNHRAYLLDELRKANQRLREKQ
jgi:hypothetical protein